jgi:hypothetical protein
MMLFVSARQRQPVRRLIGERGLMVIDMALVESVPMAIID